MDGADDPGFLLERARRLRETARSVTDPTAVAVLEDVIAELTATAEALLNPRNR